MQTILLLREETGFKCIKTVLIGAGGLKGFFVNYRGMYSPEDEEANKFIIEREESCTDFEIGDIVRISPVTRFYFIKFTGL